jgi:rubrerythrin
MATIDNLKEAFAGESQANRKYTAFAKKAEQEGFPKVARLFRAAAEAETVHAHAHLRVMGGIKSTKENLIAAIEGESHEFKQMYPMFVEEAEREGHKAAKISFEYALPVEEIHHDLYKEALESIEAGRDLEDFEVFVCGVCGNTVKHAPPEKCPICGVPAARFFEVK